MHAIIRIIVGVLFKGRKLPKKEPSEIKTPLRIIVGNIVLATIAIFIYYHHGSTFWFRFLMFSIISNILVFVGHWIYCLIYKDTNNQSNSYQSDSTLSLD